MKILLIILSLVVSASAIAITVKSTEDRTTKAPAPMPMTVKSPAKTGEVAKPTVEGGVIRVNNKLCAVSRTPMAEHTLGTFKGQVLYEGANPKYVGKTFEFNYCCAMCQKAFPNKFKANPDEILSYHGVL